MKYKIIYIVYFFTFFSYNGLKAQIMQTNELVFTRAFLDDTNLGEMTNPNILEFGIGFQGKKLLNTYGYVTIGYITFNDKVDTGDQNKLKYQSLMVGGKFGVRPFANIWASRFQPIIQLGAKTTFTVVSKNKETQESEQLFSNGITKQYDPVKITFFTGSTGFEYYISNRAAILVLGNYDYVTLEKTKFSNYSASLGLKIFY